VAERCGADGLRARSHGTQHVEVPQATRLARCGGGITTARLTQAVMRR
jgi:hypothetical protein